MTTTTEFNEADMVLALEAAGYTTYGPAEEKACKLAQIVLAASRKKLMEQPAVAYRSSEQYSPDVGCWFEYYDEYREINDTSGLTPLYAAPMPQPDESEAVKALRGLVATHCTTIGKPDPGTFEQKRAAWDAARAVLAGEPGAKDEQECDIPPFGWRCTRPAGHSGPCAAVEAPEDVSLVERGMARYRAGVVAQTQASGKAAPSDADIIHIAARTVPAFTNRDALTFARALLKRYGNASKDGAMAAGREG